MVDSKKILVRLDRHTPVIGRINDREWLKRHFSQAELGYCGKRVRCLAARLAIKEWLLGFLQRESGCEEGNDREIEIVNDPDGRPRLRLSGEIAACAGRLKIKRILISISHSRTLIAVLVLVVR